MKDNFCDLLMEERPDFKLLNNGVESMTNVDLISLIIGKSDTNSMRQARQLLNICEGNLKVLASKQTEELEVVQGIDRAKAMAILAATELGRRLFGESAKERKEIDSATAIYNFMHPKMFDLEEEEAWVLLLNNNYKLLKAVKLSHGGLTETSVDIRVAIKAACMNNATVMALSHNHPSGSIRPSRQDDQLTERFRKACDMMRIFFLDHVIVTDGKYYSYREQGRI